jgi:Domain of unknown function (DUF4129)
MASKREVPGLADMIAVAISPALIMLLVGSLIFFIIEVLYGGDYASRLRWTFGFFVFGSVLVARISIEFGDGRAALYGLALGFAAFLGMLRFVEFPPGWLEQLGPIVNIGLLILVWWCARKLTWDCTFIDDKRDASDRSVLEAAGLDNLERPPEWREPEPVANDKDDASPLEPGPIGWIQGYLRYRKAQQQKPHTPGVWVVYFSLAALPIFGLGQALIPSEEESSRHFTFWLMAIYVGSGLGLMMTTSFLGLRRYLKQKNLEIPARMAGIWLGIGTALILGFLVVGAILPRPNSETALIDVGKTFGSKERDASNYAMNPDGKGKGDGAGGDQSSKDAQSNNSTEGKSDQGGKGKGQDGSNKGSGENKGQGGDSGKSDKSGNQKGGDKNDGQKGQPGDKNQDGNKNDQSAKDKDNSSSGSPQKTSSSNSRSTRTSSSRSSSSKGPFSGSLGKVGTIIKWIVFAIMALAVAYFVFRHGLKFLANFTTWAKQLLDFLNNFWARFFGRTVVEPQSNVVEDFAEVAPPPRPFSSFQNPFDSTAGTSRTPAELVKYSFAALEAWAWEHEKGRDPQETPLEFAARMAKDYESLEKDAPRLATLYARLAYARGSLPEASRAHVEEFWRQLELAHGEARQTREPEPVEA